MTTEEKDTDGCSHFLMMGQVETVTGSMEYPGALDTPRL